MKTRLVALGAATALAMAAAPAFADHNSRNGEGTANMPNDIHNTRVETLEANDNEAFRDFVKYGEGSKVPNRYESDATTAPKAQEQNGNASSAQSQQQSRDGDTTMTQEKRMQQAREHAPGTQGQQQSGAGEKKMDQVREHAPAERSKDRSVRRQSNRTSMNNNRTSTQRSTGRRGGGGGRGGRKQ